MKQLLVKSRVSKRIINTTKEGFDKHSWVLEADRHISSAKILRSVRKRRRSEYRKATERKIKLRHIHIMDATVHSSMLLVAYAIELYLKAGLTRIYIGCSKDLFEREVKRKYGHKLVRIAREIEFPCSTQTKRHLKQLQKTLLSEGRYPFLSADRNKHIEKSNERAFRFWSDNIFNKYVNLVDEVRHHVMLLDGDEKKPASYIYYKIDDDGYFAFRYGGNLSPRIIVKYSSIQRKTRQNNKRALKKLIINKCSSPLLVHFWESADYRCVKV